MTNRDDFKRLLGPAGAHYTEGQLQQLQQEMRQMAKLLLDFSLDQKKENSRQAGHRSVASIDGL